MKNLFERVNQYLLFLVLIVIVFYFGKVILIPITFAALFAMLFANLCEKLTRKLNRALACLVCILIIFFSAVTILGIIGGQVASFQNDIPKIRDKASQAIVEGQNYISEKLGITQAKQKQIANNQVEKAKEESTSVLKMVVGSLTTIIGGFFLVLVFTFLMLYNKEQFRNFFLKLYKNDEDDTVEKVVDRITTVSQKYLTGRAMSVLINASMYAIGLSIVGIQNAILLASVAAILTLIPYLGTILGGLFPVIMALATEDSIQPALYAAVVLIFIQAIDNYFIEPNVVGGEVNLNALTSILSIIIGGLVWGVAGMILFLPLFAIIKIICDNVTPLKPYGYILGEEGNKKPSKIKQWIKNKFSNKK